MTIDAEDKYAEARNFSVAVLGLGTIGRGVCETLSAHAIKTIGIDKDPEVLVAFAETSKSTSRLEKLVRKAPNEALGQVKLSGDLSDVTGCNLIIENISENIPQKRQLYADLGPLLTSRVTVIANTSCIPIAHIAEWTPFPERVVGAHFMNPVPLRPCVEMIASSFTQQSAVDDVTYLLKTVEKRAIWVGDQPGFVTNRILMPMINDAIQMVDDNVASAAAIDQIFMGCLSHKMGPLATADLIGLDTILNSLIVLQEMTGDDRFHPAPLLAKMVRSKQLGRKSKRGFFNYGQ